MLFAQVQETRVGRDRKGFFR